MRLLLKLRFDVLTKKETGRQRRDSNPASRGFPLAWLFASLESRSHAREKPLLAW